MTAYHNDEKVKEKYLARVLAHQKADEIRRGYYWEDGKGCAVGCTVHGSEHSAYETEMGIPIDIARAEDRIFEGMGNESAKEFPLISSSNRLATFSIAFFPSGRAILMVPRSGSVKIRT